MREEFIIDGFDDYNLPTSTTIYSYEENSSLQRETSHIVLAFLNIIYHTHNVLDSTRILLNFPYGNLAEHMSFSVAQVGRTLISNSLS